MAVESWGRNTNGECAVTPSWFLGQFGAHAVGQLAKTLTYPSRFGGRKILPERSNKPFSAELCQRDNKEDSAQVTTIAIPSPTIPKNAGMGEWTGFFILVEGDRKLF